MKLRAVKVLTFLLFSLVLVLSSANIVYANSVQDSQGKVKEFKINKTHSINSLKSLSSSNIVDSDKSYISPRILSSNINKISYMYFYLRDSDHNDVTGIKVNRIEIFQSGKKLVSTDNVKSYSTVGRYRIQDAALLGNFLNPNGENKVDVVFYLFDKEVAEIKDYTFKVFSEEIVSDVWPTNIGLDSLKLPNEVTILNAGENDIIEVWVEDDENGKRITEYDGLVDTWYNDADKELTVCSKLSFKDSSYLDSDSDHKYSFVVEMNGKKLDFVDDWNEIQFDSETWVYLSYWPEDDGKYYYHVGGVNLLNNGPYKLDVKQNGELTGSISNIFATLEDDYFIMINEEITSSLVSPGEEYTTFLYDKNGLLIEEDTWMEPVDEIEEDVITPDDDTTDYFNYPRKTGIAINKDWVVGFSSRLDAGTVTTDNICVVDSTGNKVNTRLEIMPLGKAVKVYHPNDNYLNGETYYLKVKDSIKSIDGKSLNPPVKMEFVIKS